MGESSVTKYDAFLSYNSRDSQAVKELARRLEDEGLKLYFDEWEMEPGRLVQSDLIRALGSSRCCVVFVGPHGLGPWQDLESQGAVKLLVDERRDRPGGEEWFRVVRVLLPGFQLPPRDELAALGFLSLLPRVQFLKSVDDEGAFRHLVWGITGASHAKPKSSRMTAAAPTRAWSRSVLGKPASSSDARTKPAGWSAN